jgi:hypothetical protein
MNARGRSKSDPALEYLLSLRWIQIPQSVQPVKWEHQR